MKYWYQKPHQLVSEYVRTVLILEGSCEPTDANVPLFTNGMPALLCRTEKDPAGNEQIMQLTMFGTSIPQDSWEITSNATIIVYFFKPYSLASIFNLPAGRLAKTPVDLCNWSPHKTIALRTQLMYAGATARKIEVLDNLLIHQLEQQQKECEIIQYATDQIMYNSGTEIFSGILENVSISKRTFQRIFKKYVGVTPSQYRRICQFQLSFSQLRTKQFNKLTDVAYDNGFADQSHFIRSFREFTQITPQDYIKWGLGEKKQ